MTDASDAGAVLDHQDEAVLDRDGLAALVRVLKRRGRTVIGPTVRDGAIVLEELESADALPYGWGSSWRRGGTGCAAARTGRPSRTARDPSRGSRSCIHSASVSGRRTVARTVRRSSVRRSRRASRTRSSACGPAICVPFRSWTV